MAVRLLPTTEPLSFATRTNPQASAAGVVAPQPILAHSHAEKVLKHELGRYCDGLVRGRSFLIAGHRGAGKTTLLESAIAYFEQQALAQKVRLKPIPIYLQGPILLPAIEEKVVRPQDDRELRPSAATPSNVALAVAYNGAPPPEPDKPCSDLDNLEQRVLIQVAMGLHQAVFREYTSRFHLHAARSIQSQHPNANEIAELAARFHIELNEAPAPARVQEFWRCADMAELGMLFDPGHERGTRQGLLEMIALVGVSHVYQRISGKLEEKAALSASQSRNEEATSGADAKWAEFVKPLSALTVGTVVGSSSALSGSPIWALVLGVLSTLGASMVLKMTTTTTQSSGRRIDSTYMPDLSVKTLHRVMPELFERLLAAGLAPVFIIDELDKVDDLYERIHQLLDNMKKLFAERAFTCLLVDRGFYEQLHLKEELERGVGR